MEEGNLVVRRVVELEVAAALVVVRLLLLQSQSDGPTGDKCWKEFARKIGLVTWCFYNTVLPAYTELLQKV